MVEFLLGCCLFLLIPFLIIGIVTLGVHALRDVLDTLDEIRDEHGNR